MFITENTIVDSNTPLLPFYKTADTFWTTNNTWDTAEFGYNYPETQCWKYDSAQACGIAVNATIARMYPSSTRAMLTGGTAVTGTDLGHLLVDQSFIDWNIQVQGFQSNLPATFIVKFFLAGDYSSNSVTEIGAWSALTSEHSHAKAMKNKRTSSLEPDMKGTVVLTPALLDLVAVSKLKSLEENDVVPFLKKKLNWTLQEVR
jgi:tyrosinase